MAVAPSRVVTDGLLQASVGIRREAGVGPAQIQALIDKFASQQRWHDRTGGIGSPLIEDIPQENRAEFMAALAELAPDPDRPEPRYLSAAHIWPDRIFS